MVSMDPNGSTLGAYGPQYSPISTVSLVMGNNDCSIYNAGEWILWVLDKELRYPTAVARQKEAQAENPHAPPAPGGSWDGWMRLLKHRKSMPSSFPTGLVPMVSRLLEKWRVPHQIEDARTRPVEGIPEASRGGPIIDREYQLEAEVAGLREGRGVFDMPPRSGKTRTLIALVAKLGLRTIWIAPTDAIIRQTLRAFEDHLGPHFAVHQVGGKWEEGWVELGRVVLCTAATAVRLPPEFFRTREVLVVDEWHHGGAKTYREILKLCGHIYFRFGMTGTFFRSGDDAMAMHALLSNTIYKVTTTELLNLGYLVPGRVVYIPVEAPRLQCPSSDNRIVPQLKYGIQEHNIRNQMVAYTAAYLHKVGRKVLVLVATKKQGNHLRRLISGQVRPKADGAQYDPVEFLSTDRDRPTQQKILKAYNESSEVEILIGTSLVGEGVDLPAANALVYARGEKAEVSLAQNSFRPLTAIPGKRDALIVDFGDRHNKMLLNHSKQRLAFFHKEPIFSVEVLPSVKNFGLWVESINRL